jgi:hypothetical protein
MKWMGNYFNVSLSNSSTLSISPTFYARFFRTKVLHPGDRRNGCQFHQHSKSSFCADILAPWAQNLRMKKRNVKKLVKLTPFSLSPLFQPEAKNVKQNIFIPYP